MAMTWMEKLESKGREEGLKQGARRVLLDLLGKRFGPLPKDVRQRVEGIASMDHLTRLAKRVLSARSLEEMGL